MGIVGGSHIRQTMGVLGSLCEIEDICEPIPLGLPPLAALPKDNLVPPTPSFCHSLSFMYMYIASTSM